MKKPEEYIPNLCNISQTTIVNAKPYFNSDKICELIKQAQIDSWNEAVETTLKECAKNVKIENNDGIRKQHFTTENGEHFVIVKESILTLTNKLKIT